MPMKSHDVDYEILGNEMQIVEVELDPQEAMVAEAGGMMYMQDGNLVFNKNIETLRSETGEDKLSKAIAHFMKKTDR